MNFLCAIFLWSWPVLAEDPFALSSCFPTLAVFPDTSRIVYGDARGYLHILERVRKGYREAWRSSFLGSPVGGVFAEDVNGDGAVEIVLFTSGGRIYVLDGTSYRTIWQSEEGAFRSIAAMAVADIDADPQSEMVFCADGRLYVYDGESFFQEWESEQRFQARQIVVGDVDGDGEPELVLDTGFVIGVQFHDVEWSAPGGFGERIGLFDVDGDGVPEVLGETGGRLRVFDVELQREVR